MAKKNNSSNKILNLISEVIKKENFKPFLGWFILILNSIIFIIFLSNGGSLNFKIRSFLYQYIGWSSIILFFSIFTTSYFLIKKENWFKITKISTSLLLIFFIFNFYLHFVFREGGKLGYLILSFSNIIGEFGLIFLSFIFLLFSLWLILENRLFDIIKNLFIKSELSVKLLEEKIIKPEVKIIKPQEIKTVKKEIKIEEKEKIRPKKSRLKGPWKLPPLDILVQAKEEVVAPDIKQTSEIIKKTLNNFGINVEIVEVEIGPGVTRFSLKPGEGVKLSKILSLQNDIALALGIPNLYIETPIPGKAVLGVEIPNIKPAIVRLGNILREKEFLENENLLIFPLGRKINGEAMFVDLAKMPHLLIAGTTGSGKSVFIHDILISFLMKNTPETLNLVLIDPKRVELTLYSGIPHLLVDPIYEPKKILPLFNFLIEEMEERYKILQESKSRDIDSYNKKQSQKKDKLMPRIVVVIDEMADLMISYSSGLESMIIKLSQMARATGIHLILATQRPSVDIVTGLIKANIPNRVCFKVASFIDSRTVLDVGGAEKLVGSGDGLFISTFSHRPIRIQAPFVTEKEIKNIAEFWEEQGEKIHFEKEEINLEEVEKKMFEIEDLEDEEGLLQKAIEIVIQAGKASTSLLQRRLKIGYARAARLLDLMEEKGIVGPQEGSKPRKVLVDKDYLFKSESENLE